MYRELERRGGEGRKFKGYHVVFVAVLVGVGTGVASYFAKSCSAPSPVASSCRPVSFVSVADVVPNILIDARYASNHNFMGRRAKGYNDPLCLLTRPAATALALVQQDAEALGFTLKTYDCYRPQRAVDDFVQWSSNAFDVLTKEEFYSTLNKSDLFPQYIAFKSGHSRGSTLDLTLVALPANNQSQYLPGQPLTPCFAPLGQRFEDNSIDMGCGFDCFDAIAHTNSSLVGPEQHTNRMLLLRLMQDRGFVNYQAEFWHFTLSAEPYPDTYFDFPVSNECTN
mmetsp:Transcript_27362/g.53797  ORF Transcript_27362/g.53797 Transcript_27362/m.53797 type:complete len:282 (+) Transcript_27362:147-992(+)